jgi:hypothetical protein
MRVDTTNRTNSNPCAGARFFALQRLFVARWGTGGVNGMFAATPAVGASIPPPQPV